MKTPQFTSILLTALGAASLCAQQPQSPIVHTTEGPSVIVTERVFFNGKELTPQEVDQLQRLGAKKFFQMQKPICTPQVQQKETDNSVRVIIHGHELPADVSKSLVNNGILAILQEPVKKTENTEPVKVIRPEHVKVIRPEHVKVIRPDYVKVIRPEPVKVIRPEHVKVIRPEHVKVIRPDYVKVIRPEPVKVIRPKASRPCDQADTKPAEPNTPHLPTPALDAAPAQQPQTEGIQVYINGKAIQTPAHGKFQITTDASGNPVVTPLP